jgi:hypothetical protein
VQPLLDFRRKGLQTPEDQLQICFDLCLLFEALELFVQMLQPFSQPGHPRFKFRFVNQPLRIAINQAGDPSTKLAHLGFETSLLSGLVVGVQTLTMFLLESLWVLEQPTDLLPDRRIGLVHAQLLIPTDALEVVPRDIHGSRTAVVGIARVIGTSTIGIPALGTHEQALQEVARAFCRDTGSPPVLFQLRLHRLKYGGIHHSGYGNGDPFFFGGLRSRVAASGVGRSASRRTQAWAHRGPARLAKGGLAFVGRIPEHIPDGLVIPGHFARARPHASLVETATDFIEGAAILTHPRKHLSYHARFVKDHLKAGFPAAFLLVHVAIPIGRMA